MTVYICSKLQWNPTAKCHNCARWCLYSLLLAASQCPSGTLKILNNKKYRKLCHLRKEKVHVIQNHSQSLYNNKFQQHVISQFCHLLENILLSDVEKCQCCSWMDGWMREFNATFAWVRPNGQLQLDSGGNPQQFIWCMYMYSNCIEVTVMFTEDLFSQGQIMA